MLIFQTVSVERSVFYYMLIVGVLILKRNRMQSVVACFGSQRPMGCTQKGLKEIVCCEPCAFHGVLQILNE